MPVGSNASSFPALELPGIVHQRRLSTGSDRLIVDRVFRGDVAVNDRLTILNLRDVPPLDAETGHVFALSPFRQDYKVTVLDRQAASPLVYPATLPNIEEVKRLLE